MRLERSHRPIATHADTAKEATSRPLGWTSLTVLGGGCRAQNARLAGIEADPGSGEWAGCSLTLTPFLGCAPVGGAPAQREVPLHATTERGQRDLRPAMSQLAARVRAPAASGNAKALEPPDRENVSSSPSPDKSTASAPGLAPPMSPSESTSEPSPPACAAPGGAPGAKGGTGANMAAGS